MSFQSFPARTKLKREKVQWEKKLFASNWRLSNKWVICKQARLSGGRRLAWLRMSSRRAPDKRVCVSMWIQLGESLRFPLANTPTPTPASLNLACLDWALRLNPIIGLASQSLNLSSRGKSPIVPRPLGMPGGNKFTGKLEKLSLPDSWHWLAANQLEAGALSQRRRLQVDANRGVGERGFCSEMELNCERHVKRRA